MHRIARRGLAIAATLVVAAASSACGGTGDSGSKSGDTTGVTDTEILFGTHMPLTGPASAGYSKIAPATKAYFDYVNAQGGVHGRKITYKIKDDTYNPATTNTVVRELVLQDKVFAILNGLGTPTHTGVLEFLKSNKVPDLFVASGSRSWNQPEKFPHTFGFNTDYTVEGKILGTYIKKTWPDQKVCFFGQNDDFGQDSLAGLETVLGADKIVAKQNYVTTNTNVAPQVAELAKAGCQVVYGATVPGFTALLIGTAAKLPGGTFKPQWVISQVGADLLTVGTTLGAAKPLLKGMVSDNYLPSVYDATDPWIKLFKDINDKYNAGVQFDGNIVYGMAVGYLTVQALQRAGKNLTRESVVAAVEKGGFKGPGNVPLRYSKSDHSGYGGMRLSKVNDTVDKQDYFGNPFTTDDGKGEVKEYTEAVPAPPANGIGTA
ncbi:ABC transporter substrate-binding protein [Virgisporangium aliadipatigenens]|uniref:ABC transporter substrate-binding protein n=1 Tax=Virgisporangium aliadipatigenens TaxID=741659 RepID=A0A8J4DS42_9ACTN|nr:ABC transporter substrate-binding protein [Virgisporangium aliadipatigenens]GIJ46902.1 ABC transporter substrate-binding protein [Virgisporangium aliadipatigenens]